MFIVVATKYCRTYHVLALAVSFIVYSSNDYFLVIYSSRLPQSTNLAVELN